MKARSDSSVCVAHRPKQSEEVRLHPSVALYVACDVYATVQDLDALSKHEDDGFSLRSVPVTYNGLDVSIKP